MNKQICPYCNGLYLPRFRCRACGSLLNDSGTEQEALGPYAPYDENPQLSAQNACIHLLYCPCCRSEYSFTPHQHSAGKAGLNFMLTARDSSAWREFP